MYSSCHVTPYQAYCMYTAFSLSSCVLVLEALLYAVTVAAVGKLWRAGGQAIIAFHFV